MAKRGTLNHPKTLDLADRLEIMPCHALGILESLWSWAAEYRPTGDLTGITARQLARGLGFTGDPNNLLAGLCACEWVDEASGRLLVHDWSQHAENQVHTKLARARQSFCDGTLPKTGGLNKQERADYDFWLETQGQPRQNPVQGQGKVSAESGSNQTKSSSPALPCLAQPCHAKSMATAAPPPGGEGFALAASEPSEARFANFRDAVQRWWAEVNGTKPLPWDGSEQRRLKELLCANPDLTLEQFAALLRNRGDSDINPTERPRRWLASITDYASGQLDRYGKPRLSRGSGGLSQIGMGAPDPAQPLWDAIFSAEDDAAYRSSAEFSKKAELAALRLPDKVPRTGETLAAMRSMIESRERHLSRDKRRGSC